MAVVVDNRQFLFFIDFTNFHVNNILTITYINAFII